ncbi:MAG TPA: hypothetical protein VGS19_19950 [Streptosporangiaceae bacterium]|nr:hypothetical protein [Streptosporangiaceae bacterium]
MTPTIDTILAAAAKHAQDHANTLAARQAAHELHVAQRATQAPATTLPAPWPPAP